MRYIAVIDLGKTNSKVALVDTECAKEISVIKQPTVPVTQGLYWSLDHARIHTFIMRSLQALSEQVPIDAITVTTHGATVALLDSDGGLALPILDYECPTIDDTRADYDQCRPLFADTGSPALPGGLNIGAQLYWQQRTFPERFATVQTVLTWPQYWVYRLTGVKANDVTSLGCHSDLYRPRAKRYSSLIDTMQWESIMPPTVNSGQLAGAVTDDVVKQTGLGADIPVYTGIHDSNASLVPHLMMQQGTFTVVSTGTWFVVMSMTHDDRALDQHRDTLLNVNAKGDAVPSARFMGGRERELLNGDNVVNEEAMESLLHRDSMPVMVMPSAVRGTGPYPNSTLTWVNESNPQNTAARLCAVTLYLALMTHECMTLVGSDGPTYLEGPLAHDRHFAQMLAAVSDRPVYVSESETGTSVGAAMLINAPIAAPDYTPVDLKDEHRIALVRYAQRWQEMLVHHSA